MDIKKYVLDRAEVASKAGRVLYSMPTAQKNEILLAMADGLENGAGFLKKENEKDILSGKENSLSDAMLDRLLLNDSRIGGMVKGLRDVVALPDPAGEMKNIKTMPSGIKVGKLSVPIGVIGVIYESRPNVTADAAGLCIKSGNAVLLKGGSEAIHSNRAIVKIMNDAGKKAGCDGLVSFIDLTDRQAVTEMIRADKFVDLIIPRGGERLIKFVVAGSTIPVVMHYKGLCHAYVDRYADLDMAWKIIHNSKVNRPGVCNALETLLVHADIAKDFLVEMKKRFDVDKVELRGCSKTRSIVDVKPAEDEDWETEYLDLILSVKVVDNMAAAMEHIEKYSSGHTEIIITDNHTRAMKFLSQVDSSAVMVNASTRFNDGGEFGLGAEIGISTSKLHVRGPMGLSDLVCNKYIVFGSGQVRE